jgi:hypothetical protein
MQKKYLHKGEKQNACKRRRIADIRGKGDKHQEKNIKNYTVNYVK